METQATVARKRKRERRRMMHLPYYRGRTMAWIHGVLHYLAGMHWTPVVEAKKLPAPGKEAVGLAGNNTAKPRPEPKPKPAPPSRTLHTPPPKPKDEPLRLINPSPEKMRASLAKGKVVISFR